MNYPSKKTQLTIAIITALSLASCSTKETKTNSDEVTEEPPQPTQQRQRDDRIVQLKEFDSSAGKTPPIISPERRRELERHQQQKSKAVLKAEKKHQLAYQPSVFSRIASDQLLMMPSPTQANTDAENYQHFDDNGITQVSKTPVSTFSIDVDTGAYTNVRRLLNQGQLPRKDAVRAEEFINYFSYDYQAPSNSETPFAVHTDMISTPWSNDSYLLQVGIKAFEPAREQRPAANLVFLLDVSGSMNSPDKLGLLKKSLAMLTRQMTKNDRISMVVYAGASGVVLEPTAGNQTSTIELALEKLNAGGSTNGASGIKLAYQMAEKSFINNGINRIMLATDGDFNVGTTNFNALIELVEEKRKSGIALSTLGFGTGNYNDHLMEQLADKGNGQYNYIDSIFEAKKVLVDELSSSLLTVAADVKIQLEFNPQQVSEYRLIGYENRALAREDFNNDKVDAGEIGAGHTVTALYEIRLAGSDHLSVDPLRYAMPNGAVDGQTQVASMKINELGFLKLRYKKPGESQSRLITKSLNKDELISSVDQNSKQSIKFAASVAAFAQQLRGGKHLGSYDYQQIMELAQSSKGDDPRGIRSEFIQLVSMANLLSKKVL